MLTSFVACSDLKKEEVKKPALSDSRFQFDCKLEIAALKNILTDRVEDQINCLENYLVLIANILASDKPRAIGRKEFIALLSTGIDGLLEKVDGDLVQALNAVFELNFLIGSGDKNFITEAQLKNLMEILRVFNKEIIPVYQDFSNKRQIEYSWHKERRKEHYASIQRLVEPILESFVKSRDQIDQSDLLGILDVFSKNDENDTISKIKDFLVVKKIVLGGKKNIITHSELYKLFQKAPAIMAVVYDGMQYSDINFKNTLEQFDFINNALTNLGRDIIVKRRAGNGEIFTIRELEYYFKKLYKGTMKVDFFKAKKVVQLVKDIFFGEGKAFTGLQLRKFTAFLRNMGLKMEYFLELYEANQDELDKVSAPFMPKLKNLKPKNKIEVDFRNDFKEMVNHYSYFKGDNFSATLTKKTKRNAKAMLEYVVFESISHEIYTYWEKKHPCDGIEFGDDRCEKENLKSDLTMAQFKKLALLAEDFLVGAGFINPGSIEGVANSIVLLADLLVRTSNGDRAINKRETAEFATLLLSASNISTLVYDRLRLVCPTNSSTSIEPECFKEKFIGEIFKKGEDIDVSQFLPHFYEYFKGASRKDLDFMIKGALGYSQSCPEFRGEATYIDKGEITIMLIGMIHIESLIVLYDDNKSNELEQAEIRKLYDDRFAGLIQAFLDSGKGIGKIFTDIWVGKKMKYKTFLDIIAKYEVPKWRLLKIKFQSNEKVYSPGERAGLNTVLGALGGSKDEEDTFDACSMLR